MLQVAQSPFLQALGFAIINSLWQFALLWLLYVALNSIIKLTSPQKYATALTIHIAGFTWFTGTLIFYYQQCIESAQDLYEITNGYFINASSLPGTSVKNVILNVLYKGEHFLPYLSVAYIILIAFLAIKTINCYRNTQILRTQGLQKINVEWRLFVQQLAFQLGIKRPVKIYISDLVSSPITLGFLKPLILLPLATLNNLNTQQIEAVLLHELAHIKRHDYFINLILSIIEITLFFNPFMQLMSRQIKRERENSCDDWVLQYNYNVTSYARALLTIASNKHNSSSHFAMNATNDSRALLIRVKRMIEKKDRSFNYRQHLVALLFIAGIFSSITWISPAKRTLSAKKKSQTQRSIIAEPMAAKVDNPLFNPVFFFADDEKKRISEDIKKVTQGIEATTIAINNSELREKTVRKEIQEPIENGIIIPGKSLGFTQHLQALNKSFVVDTLKKRAASLSANRTAFTADLRKMESEIAKANAEVKLTVWRDIGTDKVQQQLLETLAQLDNLNIRIDNGTIKGYYLPKNKTTVLEPSAEKEITDKIKSKKVEIQKVSEEIKQQLEYLQKQKIFVNTAKRVVDEDWKPSTQVYYNSPKVATASSAYQGGKWSYSFQYNDKPKEVAVVIAPTSPVYSGATGTGGRIRLQERKEEEIAPCKIETTAPVRAVTVKKINIVRI